MRVGRGPDGIAVNPQLIPSMSRTPPAKRSRCLMLPPATRQSAQLRDAAFSVAAHREVAPLGHVDQATDTVYVPNGDDGTASVFNGVTCNATFWLRLHLGHDRDAVPGTLLLSSHVTKLRRDSLR